MALVGDFSFAVLWVVFFVMVLSAVGMGVLAFRRPDTALVTDRLHHYITFGIVAIAALAYYSMATGSGYTVIPEGHSKRPIFFARYIDWAFTTPLLLADLILLGDIHAHHMIRILFADVVMVVAGLIGALDKTAYKWGWFFIGCVFMLFIFYDLLVVIRTKVFNRGQRLGKLYSGLAVMLILLWSAYPVVWACCEGFNLFPLWIEVILYGILDVTAKVVFGCILLMGIGRISTEVEVAGRHGGPEEGLLP